MSPPIKAVGVNFYDLTKHLNGLVTSFDFANFLPTVSNCLFTCQSVSVAMVMAVLCSGGEDEQEEEDEAEEVEKEVGQLNSD